MNSIRSIKNLNAKELELCVPPNASWHTDYRDTAYIYIGGLPFDLSEGDVLTIFSQYGNPVHLNLIRDKETGKSKGFCFLKYEDQRSCDLAVDNLGGASVMGRLLSVDHTRYKKKEGEVEGLRDMEEQVSNNDTDDDSTRKRRRTSDEKHGGSEDERRPMLKEEQELAKLLRDHDADDPMKAYLVKEKEEEVTEARRALNKYDVVGKDKRQHRHHGSRRDRDPGEGGDGREKRHRHHRSDRERSTTPARANGEKSRPEHGRKAPTRRRSQSVTPDHDFRSYSARRSDERTRKHAPTYDASVTSDRRSGGEGEDERKRRIWKDKSRRGPSSSPDSRRRSKSDHDSQGNGRSGKESRYGNRSSLASDEEYDARRRSRSRSREPYRRR
ncbi:RNA-binding protein Cwf29 [Elasticomyces elasticus]|nr:RNA-binding protein Cwf29 [Elasticomyces elasticus]